jgi:hypothetical protein
MHKISFQMPKEPLGLRFASHMLTSIMLYFYTKWVPLKESNASYWQVWIPSQYHLCMKNNKSHLAP